MTDMTRTAPVQASKGRRKLGAGGVVLLAAALAGCDTLLDVELPGRIPSELIEDPALAVTLANSAQNSFECFFTNYAGGTAVFADEYITASQRSGRERWDDRSTDGTGEGTCRQETWAVAGPGYQALAFGRDLTAQFEGWTDTEVPNRQRLLSRVASYTGYAIELLAEGYCRGVVFDDNGALLDKAAAHAKAEEYFTKAVTAAQAAGTAAATELNLAYVGRARARLNINTSASKAAAITDAQNVTAGFTYNATYGTVTARENVQATENWRDRQFSVHPKLRGLTVDDVVGGVADVRVQVVNSGTTGIDGQTPLWRQQKMQNVDSPIRMASWREAQLIIAEASVGTPAGNATAVARINAVRAQYTGFPNYTPADVNDNAEILAKVLSERQRELSFEGHRMGDLRRNPTWAATQWDEGQNHLGAAYRPYYCLPFPQSEIDTNPNVDGDIR